jgi:hypothetical protein
MRLGLKALSRGERVLLAGLVLVLLFLGTFIHCGIAAGRAEHTVAANRALTSRLALTDLALFTEARYTRHLSQADRHAAFQDHPGALEHFPTGSLAGPPPNRVPYAEESVAPEATVPR